MSRHIRQAVERRALALLARLREGQERHRALKGRYWQGAVTHQATPAGGGKVAGDPDAKVAGEASWRQMGVGVAESEAAFEVHAYSGPRGDGWTLTAAVEVNGVTWTRTLNVGPESERATPWRWAGAEPSAADLEAWQGGADVLDPAEDLEPLRRAVSSAETRRAQDEALAALLAAERGVSLKEPDEADEVTEFVFYGKTSAGRLRPMARIRAFWVDRTDATRRGGLTIELAVGPVWTEVARWPTA